MAQSRARPRHTDDGHSGPSAPRIQDLARRAGVAIGTVSNVLNNPEIVTEQTRLKVEAAIAELGFVRNSAGGARRLVFLAGCPGLRLIRRRLAGAPPRAPIGHVGSSPDPSPQHIQAAGEQQAVSKQIITTC